MPATWHPFGITPATDEPHVRDPSVEGVKGDVPPLPPIKLTLAKPKPKAVRGPLTSLTTASVTLP